MGGMNGVIGGLGAAHSAFGLLVDDVAKTAAYYRDVLEYPVVRQSATFAQHATTGTVPLFSWQWAHLVEHLGKEAMARVKHRVQCALRFETPEKLDKAYEALKAAGVDFLAAPGVWEWAAYAAYFVDKEGYMWELFTWNV